MTTDSFMRNKVKHDSNMTGQEICNHGDVRFADNVSEFEGRVEICDQGMWLSVCESSFQASRSAGAICNQLGIRGILYSHVKTTLQLSSKYAQCMFASKFGLFVTVYPSTNFVICVQLLVQLQAVFLSWMTLF